MIRGPILVVEKDPLNAVLIVGQLEELGYAVEGPAQTLEDAIWLATNAPIAAALLDLSLGDGIQTASVANILAERTIPFVFLTSSVAAADCRFCEVPVLSKPVTLARLEQAVFEMLR